jgi:uncharacterized phage-associated protein
MSTENDYQSGGYLVDAVANEFLSIDGVLGSVTPMKLQKLVYFAHGWHLALTDKPLVSESVQAWKYGPVFPTLYGEFRDVGGGLIDRLADEINFQTTDGDGFNFTIYQPRLEVDDKESDFAKQLVGHIWRKIGSYSAVELSTLTHQPGTPWHDVASQFVGGIPKAVKIPNALIRRYFKNQMQQS